MACAFCGREFERSRITAIYCSKECKYKQRLSNKRKQTKIDQADKMIKFNCIICGKEFFAVKAYRKCCSELCTDKHRKNLTLAHNRRTARFKPSQTERKAILKKIRIDRKQTAIRLIEEQIEALDNELKICDDRLQQRLLSDTIIYLMGIKEHHKNLPVEYIDAPNNLIASVVIPEASIFVKGK